MKRRLLILISVAVAGTAFAQNLIPVGNDWYYQGNRDPITDVDKSYVAKIAYDSPEYDQGILFIRCNAEAPEGFDIYLSLDDYIGDRGSVDVITRFDREPPTTTTWVLSTDNTAIFADGANYMKSLVANLVSHTNLAVRLSDLDGTPLTYQVDLTGSTNAVQRLTCLAK